MENHSKLVDEFGIENVNLVTLTMKLVNYSFQIK